jgi:hypothetical protein
VTVAILCCSIFLVIGRGSPVVAEVTREFGKSVPWQARFLEAVHPYWTIPLGLVIALSLLLKDRYLQRDVAQRLNVIFLIAVISLLAVWIYAVYSRIHAVSGNIYSVPGYNGL